MQIRKKRAESFFGLHFDFHAEENTIVGENLRYDVVSKLLDEVRPDYVQVDSKGHPGYSSYPTRFGNQAPHLKGDHIKMWRDLTAERGIALYAHYSGLFDMKVSALHPEWAAIDKNRSVTQIMSVFGPYADEVLIPQLLELALVYGLDGAWVDGECWATIPDYSENAVQAYKKVHGGSNPPEPGDENYFEYMDFCRDGFEKYVAHYVQKVKEKAPDFQITSNWLYSMYMPKKPTIPVDFLSGDYMPNNSVDSARINARFLANQGLPWDLMAWGHNSEADWKTKNRSTKELIQHCQEAAYVISLGGGFQLYNLQYHGGSTVQEWAIPIWKKTAEFVRAREIFCKNTKQYPQIGVYTPYLAQKRSIDVLYGQVGSVMLSAQGLIHLSQDSGYSSEILETHNLFDRKLADYGVIIVSNINEIEEDAKQALLSYVYQGGSLLLSSADASGCFSDITGVNMDKPEEKQLHIESEGSLVSVVAMSSEINCVFENLGAVYYDNNYMEGQPHTAAALTPYGEGKIVSLCFDIGGAYPKNRSSCIRSFYKNLIGGLFPRPIVTVKGSDYVDLTVMQRDDTLFIHLLNYAGPHNSGNYRSYNDIPALGPLDIILRLDKPPVSIFLEPEHTLCEFTFDAGEVRLGIERLKIHTILSVRLS